MHFEHIIRLFPWLTKADDSKSICCGQLEWDGKAYLCLRCGRVLTTLPMGQQKHYPPPFLVPIVQVTTL